MGYRYELRWKSRTPVLIAPETRVFGLPNTIDFLRCFKCEICHMGLSDVMHFVLFQSWQYAWPLGSLIVLRVSVEISNGHTNGSTTLIDDSYHYELLACQFVHLLRPCRLAYKPVCART